MIEVYHKLYAIIDSEMSTDIILACTVFTFSFFCWHSKWAFWLTNYQTVEHLLNIIRFNKTASEYLKVVLLNVQFTRSNIFTNATSSTYTTSTFLFVQKLLSFTSYTFPCLSVTVTPLSCWVTLTTGQLSFTSPSNSLHRPSDSCWEPPTIFFSYNRQWSHRLLILWTERINNILTRWCSCCCFFFVTYVSCSQTTTCFLTGKINHLCVK